jgi:hypothetical protein
VGLELEASEELAIMAVLVEMDTLEARVTPAMPAMAPMAELEVHQLS